MTHHSKTFDTSSCTITMTSDITMKDLKDDVSQEFRNDNSIMTMPRLYDEIVPPIHGSSKVERNGQDRPYRGVESRQVSLQKLKTYYKLRGWALMYPFLLSVFFVIQERMSLRALGFAFMALTCLVAFIKMRSLKPRTNLFIMGLSMACIAINLFDFLIQFDFIGSSGWKHDESYKFCFEESSNKEHELHKTICKGLLVIYYFHAVVYLLCLSCFSLFLFASAKLLSLTSYVANDKTYRVELEEEIDNE